MEEKSGDTNKNAESLIHNLLLDKIEQPKTLFEILFNIQLEDHKVLDRCIYDLNHKHSVDFCVLGVQAINDGLSCMDVLDTLAYNIPDLNHKVDSVIQLLETLHSNNQSLPIEQLVKKQPDFARHLLDKLLANSTSFSVDYISTIFCTLAEPNIKDIHAELLSLTNNDSVYVVQAVINALGRLDYQMPSNQKELEQSIQVLNKLSKKKNENIDLAIVHAYGYLVKISEQAQVMSDN